MHNSKTTGIEDLIQDNEDTGMELEDGATAGRKRERRPIKPLNTSQAWRALEDRLNERALRKKLKEIYDD
ncbi:MAG: hypothetical protein KGK44_10000 [Gammaproteobacteria bacterium]|nr:hypothetical protein [Gammaproteobacteria bacterium]